MYACAALSPWRTRSTRLTVGASELALSPCKAAMARPSPSDRGRPTQKQLEPI